MNSKQSDGYDVLIVGAGVIGLACAWRAAARGLRVCVLERESVAAGASGVAAGMLAPVGEASWGEERLLALNIASLRRWDAFAAELEAEAGTDVDYQRWGAVHVAADRDEAEALRRRHQLHERLGLDSRWLRPSETRRLEPGLAPAITAGLHAPGESAVDPQALCRALAASAAGMGARIETGAEVIGTELGPDSVDVRTADGGEFVGARLVVAAGCWSGAGEWLPANLRPPIRPVKGELIVLRGDPAETVCGRIVASERVYIVPRSDGRLIVGATVEERSFDTRVTAGGVHELLREAYRLLPEIAELELVEVRAGLRPTSPDNAPLIGRIAPAALIATGHYRNGILQAPITAEAVVALLADEPLPSEVEPFGPDRFQADPAAAPEPAEVVGR